MISFKDIELKDKELITSYTQHSPRRNCDLSFSNLCSWRFLYDTKFAVQDGFLILKFCRRRIGIYDASRERRFKESAGGYDRRCQP